MSREDIARLLGGYATGTLTPEERQALFAAALQDQDLFDELQREQALHDLLREPAARAQLLAALEDRLPWYRRFGEWMLCPAALTAVAVCLLLVASVAILRPWRGYEAAKPPLVATALPQEAPPIPSPPLAAGQKTTEVTAMEAMKKAKAPAVSPAARAFMPPAASAAREELPLPESAAQEAQAGVANKPAAAAPPPAIPATPAPAPKAADQKMTADLSNKRNDAAEQTETIAGTVAPGAGQPGSAPARNAFAGGALSANSLQQASAPAVASDGGARQRYYAGTMPPVAPAKAHLQSLQAPRVPASQPVPLGIKWSILRREANGGLTSINAEDLRAGDAVEVRLTSNQSCDLSVFDNANGKLALLFAKHVEAGEAIHTPLLTPGDKGLRELLVELARGSNVKNAIATARPDLSRQSQRSETDRSEQTTYTVGPTGAPQVFLSITLNYR